MNEVKKILCPVEFGENFSKEIVHYAANMVKSLNSELVVVHVNLDNKRFARGREIEETLEKLSKYLDGYSQIEMNQLLADECVKGIKVSGIIIDGDPAREIVRLAKDENVDLIIMGTHGKGAIPKFVFGSVAQKVVRDATVPVLTVKP